MSCFSDVIEFRGNQGCSNSLEQFLVDQSVPILSCLSTHYRTNCGAIDQVVFFQSNLNRNLDKASNGFLIL